MGTEKQRVYGALYRARAQSLPATLTEAEWEATVAHFGGRCAYCQVAPFVILEHFIDVRIGGGTTAGNCLPACVACNEAKKKKRPEHYRLIFGEARVAELVAFLKSRSRGNDFGTPTPAAKRRTTVYLDVQVAKALRIYQAEDDREDISEIINQAVVAYLAAKLPETG